MTKGGFIYKTLLMLMGNMALSKQVPETKELFIQKVIEDAKSIIDYPESDIKEILFNTDVMQKAADAAEVLAKVLSPEK